MFPLPPKHYLSPSDLAMDPLFDRLETIHAKGIITADELETLKAGVVELALIPPEEINLAEEPDFVGTDGRSLVEHAKVACDEAGIDLEDDEDDGDDGDE